MVPNTITYLFWVLGGILTRFLLPQASKYLDGYVREKETRYSWLRIFFQFIYFDMISFSNEINNIWPTNLVDCKRSTWSISLNNTFSMSTYNLPNIGRLQSQLLSHINTGNVRLLSFLNDPILLSKRFFVKFTFPDGNKQENGSQFIVIICCIDLIEDNSMFMLSPNVNLILIKK